MNFLRGKKCLISSFDQTFEIKINFDNLNLKHFITFIDIYGTI